MQLVLQSSFLQALAYSLIASVWQMAILWFATIALLKVFTFSAAQKFRIAFTAQLGGFLCFIYTCAYAYKSGTGDIITGLNGPGFITNFNSFINVIMPYTAVLYLGTLFFKFIKLTIVFRNTLGFKKYNLKKIAAEQRIFVQRMSELFSIHRKVKIYLSEKIVCPLTTGFFKPVILIPVAAINCLTTQQLEAVILHELAHIKRADYVLYIVQTIIEKIFFFNVFSMMLGDTIERERENACDDWVLQFRYNSMHYAEALFKLGRLKALPVMAMPLQGKKENLLLMRIRRLLHKQNSDTYNIRPVLLGLISLICCAGLLTSTPGSMPKEFAGLNVTTANIARNNYASNVRSIVNNEIMTEPSAPVTVPLTKIFKQPKATLSTASIREEKVALKAEDAIVKVQDNALELNQQHIYNVVQKSLDSLKPLMPQYTQAVAANIQMNAEALQKIASYQNFKQLEAMLAASSDSITVKESEVTKNSYKKLLTIESFDKNGNKHVYSVVVELYQ